MCFCSALITVASLSVLCARVPLTTSDFKAVQPPLTVRFQQMERLGIEAMMPVLSEKRLHGRLGLQYDWANKSWWLDR